MSQLGGLVGVVDYQRLRPFLLHHRVFTPAQITRYGTGSLWRIRIPEPGFLSSPDLDSCRTVYKKKTEKTRNHNMYWKLLAFPVSILGCLKKKKKKK
jgi:hypothetical protein